MLLSVAPGGLFMGINDDPKYERTVWNCPNTVSGCGTARIEQVAVYADAKSGTWSKVMVAFKALGSGQPRTGWYNLDTGARQVNYSGRGNAGWTVYFRGTPIGGNTPAAPKPKQKVTELK
jgi:hypothetical protein